MEQVGKSHCVKYSHLIYWCEHFVERHIFRLVLGDLPEANAETVTFYKIFKPGN